MPPIKLLAAAEAKDKSANVRATSRGTPRGANSRTMLCSRTPMPFTLMGSIVRSETIGTTIQ